MIPHLRGREKALAQFGWKGRDAEWIALVCLHSGVFTRGQWSTFLRVHPEQSRRGVHPLVKRGLASEDAVPDIGGVGRVCRIFSRRIASPEVLLRRLLSLDYVLERPELAWLPTELEKVRCFESLGFPRQRLPLRVYRGAVWEKSGATLRSSCRLPWRPTKQSSYMSIPGTRPVRPCGLGEWRIEAFGKLCAKGAARARWWPLPGRTGPWSGPKRCCTTWADGSGPKAHTGDPSAAREYTKIKRAVLTGDARLLYSYGGVTAAAETSHRVGTAVPRSLLQGRNRRLLHLAGDAIAGG